MKYAKAIAAAVGSLLVVVTAVLTDNVIGMEEWGQLVTALVVAGGTVYGVFKVENKDS